MIFIINIPDTQPILKETKVFLDTNVMLLPKSIEEINKYDKFYISSVTIQELENIKTSSKKDDSVKYFARKIVRYLAENQDKYEVVIVKKEHYEMLKDKFLEVTPDNLIIACAYDKSKEVEDLVFVTGDLLCELIARDEFGLNVVKKLEIKSDFVDYKGFKEIAISQRELKQIYMHLDENNFDLLVNEYLIVNDVVGGELLDILKWNGNSLESFYDKKGKMKLINGFKTKQFGTFIPKDTQQMIAVDSIFNNQLTCIRGKAGSGKSLIALNTAWKLVETQGYRLVIFTNPTPVLNSSELGFYKGSRLEKLLQSSAGTMLRSKFDTEVEIIRNIEDGRLDLLPFVDLRGYDTSGEKTIVWIVESQNLTSELLKMGLQRIGSDTKVIVDGDFHQQVDKKVYAIDNGMKRMSEVFRGRDLYGEVELQTIHRSEIAEIAQLM